MIGLGFLVATLLAYGLVNGYLGEYWEQWRNRDD